MGCDEQGVSGDVTLTSILLEGLPLIRCVRSGSSTLPVPLGTFWSLAGVSGMVTENVLDTDLELYWRLVISCNEDDRRVMDTI